MVNAFDVNLPFELILNVSAQSPSPITFVKSIFRPIILRRLALYVFNSFVSSVCDFVFTTGVGAYAVVLTGTGLLLTVEVCDCCVICVAGVVFVFWTDGVDVV